MNNVKFSSLSTASYLSGSDYITIVRSGSATQSDTGIAPNNYIVQAQYFTSSWANNARTSSYFNGNQFLTPTGQFQFTSPYLTTLNVTSQQLSQSAVISMTTADGKSAGLAHYSDGHANGQLLDIVAQPGLQISLSPGGLEAVRINTTGSVGIGTKNPAARLHVIGSRLNNSARILVTDETGGIARLNADGYYNNTDEAAGVFLSGNGNQGIKMVSAGVASYITAGAAGLSLSYAGGAGLDLLTNSRLSFWGQHEIVSSGSANFVALKIIAADNQSSNVVSIGKVSTPGSYLTLNAAGNVGIGTTSPANKAHIQFNDSSHATNYAGLTIENLASGGSESYINLLSAGYGTGWRSQVVGGSDNVDGSVSSYLAFRNIVNGAASPSEVMRIYKGNVGIGTTSPTYKLDIIDSDGNSTFRLGSDTSQYIYIDSGGVESHIYSVGVKPFYLGANGNFYQLALASGGNVGIGTTSPNTKLEVSGTFRAGNTSDTYMTYDSAADNITLRKGSYYTSFGFDDANSFIPTIGFSGGPSELIIKAGNLYVKPTAAAGLVNAIKIENTTGTANVSATGISLRAGGNVSKGLIAYKNQTAWGVGDLTFGINSSADNTVVGLADARMTIQGSNGNVGIGTTSPSHQLTLSTDSATKPSSNVWSITSDERIKTNIVPADLSRCYEIVKQVGLKHFGFKPGVYNDGQIKDKHTLGFIAQDVQKVFGKAVSVSPFTLQTDIPDGIEEYEEQDFTLETVDKVETSIQVINGKPVQVSKVVTSENKVMLFDMVDVLDESGAAVMESYEVTPAIAAIDATEEVEAVESIEAVMGTRPVTYKMPRMITKTRPKVRREVIEDCLDLNGGQMNAALYGAVQCLMAKVEAQAVTIAALQTKVGE